MGKVIGVVGKKVTVYIALALGLLACIYAQVLYYEKGKYGYEWFLAFIFYAFALGLSLIVQFSILATDFEPKEVAYGAGTFISAIASSIVLQLYAYFSI